MATLRRRTGKYWERRSLERLSAAEKASQKHIARINSTYNQARRQVVSDVKDMYLAYYRNKRWDTRKLEKLAPASDVNRFLRDMQEAGLETRLPERYQGRMTRLELLNAQIWGEIKKAGLKDRRIQDSAYRETVTESYHRTVYDTARGLGHTPVFDKLDSRTVDKIISARFHGANYSERVWTNTDILASTIQDQLAVAVATGQAAPKTVREIRQRFNVNRFAAERLVRTETNFFENTAEMEAYGSMGIERWVFVATLDGRTSQICQDHDGRIYPVGKGEPPPLHPNCRSTIRPYIGPEYEPDVRIARDRSGRNVYVDQMTYGEWKKRFVQ